MDFNQSSKHKIQGIIRDEKGEISAYKLETGEILTKQQAVKYAKEGSIEEVSVVVSKNGEEFLRSLPDNTPDNNLENLPNIDVQEGWRARNGNHS